MLSLVAPTGAALQMSLYANTMTIKAFLFFYFGKITSVFWQYLAMSCDYFSYISVGCSEPQECIPVA